MQVVRENLVRRPVHLRIAATLSPRPPCILRLLALAIEILTLVLEFQLDDIGPHNVLHAVGHIPLPADARPSSRSDISS